MSIDYETAKRSEMRRADRQVNDEQWIRAMLRDEPIAVIATVQNGQPFLRMLGFLYEEAEHTIYIHGAKEGRGAYTLGLDGRLCLTVYRFGRMIPSKRAFTYFLEYASVIVFGQAVEIHDDAIKAEKMQRLMNKWAPQMKAGIDYEPGSAEELGRTAVYRVAIEEWSGKQKNKKDETGYDYYEATKATRMKHAWEEAGHSFTER